MKLSVLLAIACLIIAAFIIAGCLKGKDASNVDAVADTAEAAASVELRRAADRVDAPPIHVTTLDDKETTLDAKQSKKRLIVNFWATWCPPCRAEMPDLDALAKELHGRDDVAFYAVNLGDSADTVHKFLVEEGINDMTVLLDKDSSVSRQYAIQSIPTTILIDLNGKIAYRKIGMTNGAEIKAALAALEAERQ